MRALREAALLVILALIPATISGVLQLKVRSDLKPPTKAVGEVSLEEVRAWKEVLWVDARSREAYEAEHIPGALLLNAAEWDDLLVPLFDRWNPDVPIVVYCDSASCDASQRVAERLRDEVGLEHVHVLKGGWSAWKEGR